MNCVSKKCAETCGKVLQVLVLLAIILYVFTLFIDLKVKSSYILIALIIIYIFYLISEFCSSTFSFLCNKTNTTGIKNTLSGLIKTNPSIEFYCECYHYVTVAVRYSPPKRGGGRKGGGGKKGGKKTVKRGGGGNHSHHGVRHTRKKVVSWRETSYFPYYSARDVSGLFELDNSREKAMGKVYIKLELTPEINFADELSYMDYENFRNNFYNRNRARDQYMDYRETRSIPGLKTYNFVCIRDEEPCGINPFLFVILTIIPLVELYKCYINSYCLEQSFKIRKLISTRYDLNQVNQEKYQYLIPSINVPNQKCAFESDNYTYINNDYKIKLPTENEISEAQKYKDKIPQYQCVSYTSINDEIKVGVVQDDPAYCSANINDAPPPNCQNMPPAQPKINNNNNNNDDLNLYSNKMNMINNGIDSNNNLNNNYNVNNNPNNYNNMNNYNMNNNNNMNNNLDEDDDDSDDDDNQNDLPYSGS